MEINLNNCVYAINPRRIIAIESYKTDYFDRRIHRNPYSEDELDEDGNPKRNNLCVIIHMTDNFIIEYNTDVNSEYEKLRDELERIVGG